MNPGDKRFLTNAGVRSQDDNTISDSDEIVTHNNDTSSENDIGPEDHGNGSDIDDSSVDVRPKSKYRGDYGRLRPAGSSKTIDMRIAGPNGANHAEIIRRELATVLTEEQMNKYRIIQKEDEYAEQLFAIADEVSLAERTAIHYSNFHTYNAFRNIHTPEEARQAVSKPDGTWRQMAPYANCLAMASANCNALRRRLQGLTRLRRYAYRVELVTDNWEQNPTNDMAYHCICILRLDQFCIVIDPLSHRGAQRVPLGQIGGYSVEQNDQNGMRWAYVRGPRNARLLVEYAPSHLQYVLARPHTGHLRQGMEIQYTDPFSVVKGGLIGGVMNLAYPSSKKLYPSKHGRGEFPSRRTIHMLSIWNRQPTFTDTYSVAAGNTPPQFLVSTATLVATFEPRRSLHLKWIPCADWLARPENRHLLREVVAYMSLRRRQDWTSKRHVSCEVRFRNWPRLIKEGFNVREQQGIRLLEAISGGLNQPNGEVSRIADVMLSVWRTQAAAVKRDSAKRS